MLPAIYMRRYHRHIDAHSTAHLSLAEEGALCRLLDWQYSREAPLPPTQDALYRIARATTPAERRAALKVATDYFSDGGWHPQARRDIQGEQPPAGVAPPTIPVAPAAPATPQPATAASRPPAPPAPIPPKPAAPAAPLATPEEVIELGSHLFGARNISPARSRPVLDNLCLALGADTAFRLLLTCKEQRPHDPLSWLQRAITDRQVAAQPPGSPCG